MNWAGPEFVLAIIAISTGGWVITSWIRAKHGYPLEGEFGGNVGKLDDKRVETLAAENDKLKASQLRLEERIAVLERIATDAPTRLIAEIDALRVHKIN